MNVRMNASFTPFRSAAHCTQHFASHRFLAKHVSGVLYRGYHQNSSQRLAFLQLVCDSKCLFSKCFLTIQYLYLLNMTDYSEVLVLLWIFIKRDIPIFLLIDELRREYSGDSQVDNIWEHRNTAPLLIAYARIRCCKVLT